jgi:hypothetical protein
LARAPLADSGPISYLRHDNTFSILYNAQGHIIELHLTNNWHYHDLTVLAHAPMAQAGRPSAYKRADGVNSVVYRGTSGLVYELYNFSGDTWQFGNLSLLAQ